jgi:signal transduction histidine kinase
MSDVVETPRSEGEQALMEYLAESGVLAATLLDRDGTIVNPNRALERFAGRPLAGVQLNELMRPEQRPALETLLNAGAHEWTRRQLGLFPNPRGVPLDFEVSCRSLSDRLLLVAEPLADTVHVVNEQLLVLNDQLAAAQRRIGAQNAELAAQNDRLRELDRLKDALLANVSHDLRTPLTAILGYTELLRRRGGLTEKQTQAVTVIERNARRLLRQVNDLLLVAELQAGALRLEREPVDLAELARDAVELADPLAEDASIDMSLEAPKRGPVIQADRTRLSQLLDNLVSNAIKYTPAGGSVRVRVRGQRGGATLEVEDTGPGIPEAQQRHLFAPFTRGGQTGKPGTGLGLTIARAVADAHDATISLRSQAGRGARFTVTFRPRRGAHS